MKFILLFFLSFNAIAQDALVWGGPGACKDGCVEAAVHVTQMAGLNPMIVTIENYDKSLLEKAKVWVQPGGKSSIASNAMGAQMRADIKNFIAAGGGYVGFCAGAFLTTPKVGTSRTPGLGIVPGKTKLFQKPKGFPSVEAMITDTGIRYHYWEGGPFLSFSSEALEKIKVTSRYQTTNQINSIETNFGKGRIAISGTHPEAPQWWYDDAQIKDQDGLDNEIARDMVKWSANLLE